MINRDYRRIEFDILKGLLIICVVSGHTTLNYSFIDVYWFHMPAFFILSGYMGNHSDFSLDMIKKKAKRLWLPYILWCLILLPFIPECTSPAMLFVKYFTGGGYCVTALTYPFWFVNSLFVSLIIYSYMKKILGRFAILSVISIIWFTIHMVNIPHLLKYPLPMGMDYALGAICYITIGDLLKNKDMKRFLLFAIVVVIASCVVRQFGIYEYSLNMLSMHYSHIILDIVVPSSFTLVLYAISTLLGKVKYVNKIIAYIGNASLVIMFLHVSCLFIMDLLNMPMFVSFISGVIIPTIIYAVLRKFQYSKILLLGENHKR